MDRIIVSGARFSAHVGVPPHERSIAQEVVVDIEVEFDVSRAGASDHFADTVDYASIHAAAQQAVTERPYSLVESMAEARRHSGVDGNRTIAIHREGARFIAPGVARRLELCLQTGRPASEILTRPVVPEGLRGVVLTRDRDDLQARISAAVDARLSGGAIDEVRAARTVAGGTARQILGWREITAFLDGKTLPDECRDNLAAATRQYAKRQLTWFRGKSTFPLLNLSDVTPDLLDRTARALGLP